MPRGLPIQWLSSPKSIHAFSALILLFAAGMWLASSTNVHAASGLKLTLLVCGVTLATYAFMHYAFKGARFGSQAMPTMRARLAVFWAMFGLCVLGAVVLLVFAPTTAMYELFRHISNAEYRSTHTDIEIRLATALMPRPAEAITEIARRLAMPYCLLEFFVGGLPVLRQRGVGVTLVALAVVFSALTLDRAVPVMYFAMGVVALVFAHGRAALTNKYLYLNLIGIAAVIVAFKNIQYGEIRQIQFTPNSQLVRNPQTAVQPVAPAAKPDDQRIEPAAAASDAKAAAPQSQQQAALPAVSDAPPSAAPKSEPAAKVAEPPQPVGTPAAPVASASSKNASKSAAAPAAPAVTAPRPDAAKSAPPSPPPPAEERPGATKYALYFVTSIVERVLLSPIAMALYAVESYSEADFKHWSETRLFATLGLGRYISPFETGKKKYHDAFPVTLIGDLWRNGGYRYAPHYAAFLACVLLLIDRRLFAGGAPIALRVLSLFGVLVLFYGNAFNATSWMLIVASLGLSYLYEPLDRWLKGSTQASPAA